MAPDFVRCGKCGKAFLWSGADKYCADCAAKQEEYIELISEAIDEGYGETIEAIAHYTGLPVQQVNDLVEESEVLRKAVHVPKQCVKCKAQPAQRGSQFCFACRLDLYTSFASAVAELSEKMTLGGYEPHRAYRSSGLLAELERKRGRASMGRLNPTPRGRMER